MNAIENEEEFTNEQFLIWLKNYSDDVEEMKRQYIINNTNSQDKIDRLDIHDVNMKNSTLSYCMKNQLEILKGIHPGLFLERELKKRKLTTEEFANSLNEHPQTLTSITKGKRKMNTDLALKIEKALGLEEGYLMILQAYYDIDQKMKKQNTTQPNLSILRPSLFWDTKIENINWTHHRNAVINRIFERGNQKEKDEITRFYGKDVVEKTINEKEA